MTQSMTLRPGDAAALQTLRPAGGFQILLADPPWRYTSNSEAKPGKNAMGHYPCMKLADICALPIRELAAENALLLLWVTVPFAELAFQVVKAWGFSYRSGLAWPKSRIAHGHWARNQHELLYICRRGKFPCERPALFPTSLIPGRTREHSRKPDWVHDVLDRRYPEATKAELFARAPRPGWVSIGNQTDKFAGEGEAA